QSFFRWNRYLRKAHEGGPCTAESPWLEPWHAVTRELHSARPAGSVVCKKSVSHGRSFAPGELGAAMDLGSLLRSLGLEQYEPAFRENAIDDSVLLRLTAEDLKDLGIDIVGHRRKLLDAIAVLRTDANAEAAPTNP